MLQFTHDVPALPHGNSLPIRRTPAYGNLTAIVTIPDLLGCYTHFYKGRTMPCTGPDCEAHKAGIPFRWHAYMSAWETKSALHFIFEVTAQATEAFVAYRQNQGTLRGCLFQAKRWRERPNGRVLIQTKPAELAKLNLPEPPNLESALAILWNLNAKNGQPRRIEPEKQVRLLDTSVDEKREFDINDTG